uniref:Reverse transcriptase domain-containing protein n=1 Tax=Peronospora matthiolae TaxID=2874970 RepID=A0AAV1TZL7_9STRA
MVEFAINNSVHASTTHTPFYVNGLRHPRVPTLLECNSGLGGEGTRASKIGFVSRSDEEVIAFDADIDNIDIEEDDASESAEALTEDNDPCESAEALTEEKVVVAAVSSQHTEANESSDEFILAREMVVRFVQDSIAEAVT